MSNHNRIDYFEFPATDLAASKRFYSVAFDWTFTDYGPVYAGFGYPGGEREAGGFSADQDHTRVPLPILYSDDLEASLKRVLAAQGKIVKPIFSFPGGRRFHFMDPCGNELAVWSDK